MLNHTASAKVRKYSLIWSLYHSNSRADVSSVVTSFMIWLLSSSVLRWTVLLQYKWTLSSAPSCQTVAPGLYWFYLARFSPSERQVSGIMWGHGRLSLALCWRGTCHSHQFQTYDADDVVVCSGQCGVGIYCKIWTFLSIKNWMLL
jgi:hypothetical protein